MTTLTVILGVLEGAQTLLARWSASSVPRDGDRIKIGGKRYVIVDVEWEPPTGAFTTTSGAADPTVILTVLKDGW